jgi:hypothetical protein
MYKSLNGLCACIKRILLPQKKYPSSKEMEHCQKLDVQALDGCLKSGAPCLLAQLCVSQTPCAPAAAPGLELVLADSYSNFSTLKDQAICFVNCLLAGRFVDEINKSISLYRPRMSFPAEKIGCSSVRKNSEMFPCHQRVQKHAQQ